MDAIKRYGTTVFLAVAIAYFGYHALTGEQGVLNWIVVKNEIRIAEAELDLAVAEREMLEDTASRLRSDSLDLDYVEERARDILNVAHPREIIVEIEPSPQH
ncbi:FtsB family cell division protein [Maricaulis parjimensis]|uniref:FtsB family cell division protein n=1 Tax=Maricaulis parjimensis TaxID=144023 RepID=UPI00193AAD67|nr:septum formation initiator family protein [Maricaulis parjimensis]